MATASKIKASEKQAICKKLTALLKKRYGGSVPKVDLPVMESMIFAALLEDETYERARQYYDRLFDAFHDLNEIRVSSYGELETVLAGIENSDWKSLRVRSILQYVFEKTYVFDFESIKKKTLDLATRQLTKIPNLSPFVVNWTIQQSLGGHLVPLDTSMRNAAAWLGLLEAHQTANDGAEALKAAVRKADTPLFSYLLKSLAIDPVVKGEIESAIKKSKGVDFDPTTAVARLPELFDAAASAARKKKRVANAKKRASAAAKPAPKAASAGKTPAKKKAKTPARKK